MNTAVMNENNQQEEQAIRFPNYLFVKHLKQKADFSHLNWPDVLEYLSNPEEVPKNKAPLIGSHDGLVREKEDVLKHNNFTLAIVDVDTNDLPLESLIEKLNTSGLIQNQHEYIIYSSVRSDTNDEKTGEPLGKRWRIMIPLKTGVPHTIWEDTQRYLGFLFTGDACTNNFNQLAYMPNRGPGDYTTLHSEGEFLDLTNKNDMFVGNVMCWNQERRADEQKKREKKEQAKKDKANAMKTMVAAMTPKQVQQFFDSSTSVIQAFKEQFSVADVLDQFGFYPIDGKRWIRPKDVDLPEEDRSPGIINFGDRYYCHHSNDPLHNPKGGDSFDILRIVEYNGDEAAAVRGAADKWLLIGEEAWNKVKHREFRQTKANDSLGHRIERILSKEEQNEHDEQANEAPFKFMSMQELLNRKVSYNWLVKKTLQRNRMAIMIGEAGCGKTLLVIDMLVHIAAGLPWCGRRVVQGAVFYIGGEGHDGLRNRVDACCRLHDINPDLPIYFSEESMSLVDAHDVQRVTDSINEMQKACGQDPVLIVIDTLATNLGAGSENSNDDLNQVTQNVNRYLKAPAGASVILVHHVGHNNKDRGRGGYSLIGNADNDFIITRKGRNIEMMPKKHKDHKNYGTLVFESQEVNLGTEYDPVDEEYEEITGIGVKFVCVENGDKDREQAPTAPEAPTTISRKRLKSGSCNFLLRKILQEHCTSAEIQNRLGGTLIIPGMTEDKLKAEGTRQRMIENACKELDEEKRPNERSVQKQITKAFNQLVEDNFIKAHKGTFYPVDDFGRIAPELVEEQNEATLV